MIARVCLIAALVAAQGAQALDLPGNARLTAERLSPQDRYDVPLGPYDGQSIPVLPIEGQVRRQAWQVPGAGLTLLQIMAPLRTALEAEGFDLRLDCVADRCGGFDFRFGTEVLPAPAMFVALRNFHFVTLTKGDPAQPEAATTVLVSVSRDAAYVQIIEARQEGAFLSVTTGQAPVSSVRPTLPDEVETVPPPEQGDFLTRGYKVLEGVDFESGATSLGPDVIPALEQLAAIMQANPKLRVALVGHTDSVGSLEGNIAISRARAVAVRDKLIADHGVDAARLEAEGMGYLAPRSSNLTDLGRETNRRVEAIILSNE